MQEEPQKLIHIFGAMAELGQEIANKSNFQDTIRTSLHLLLGSLGIMRGGVARYSRYGHEMNMVALRGLGEDFPLSLSLCDEDERQFLTNGLHPFDIKQAKVLPFFQVYDGSFESKRVEFVPLIFGTDRGAVFLAKRPAAEFISKYIKRSFADGRHTVSRSRGNLMPSRRAQMRTAGCTRPAATYTNGKGIARRS